MKTTSLSAQQALGILTEATSAVQGNRQQHELIVQALQTLKAAITPPEPLKKEEPSERKQSKRQDASPKLV